MNYVIHFLHLIYFYSDAVKTLTLQYQNVPLQQKLFTWKQLCVFILYSNKKLLIYHFHQETSSIVHLVEVVMYDTFLTSFTVYVKKA